MLGRLHHARLLNLQRVKTRSWTPVHLLCQPCIASLCASCCVQVGSNTPNFNQMAGNPLAKQIPWDTNPTTLAAWKEGNTGELH